MGVKQMFVLVTGALLVLKADAAFRHLPVSPPPSDQKKAGQALYDSERNCASPCPDPKKVRVRSPRSGDDAVGVGWPPMDQGGLQPKPPNQTFLQRLFEAGDDLTGFEPDDVLTGAAKERSASADAAKRDHTRSPGTVAGFGRDLAAANVCNVGDVSDAGDDLGEQPLLGGSFQAAVIPEDAMTSIRYDGLPDEMMQKRDPFQSEMERSAYQRAWDRHQQNFVDDAIQPPGMTSPLLGSDEDDEGSVSSSVLASQVTDLVAEVDQRIPSGIPYPSDDGYGSDGRYPDGIAASILFLQQHESEVQAGLRDLREQMGRYAEEDGAAVQSTIEPRKTDGHLDEVRIGSVEGTQTQATAKEPASETSDLNKSIGDQIEFRSSSADDSQDGLVHVESVHSEVPAAQSLEGKEDDGKEDGWVAKYFIPPVAKVDYDIYDFEFVDMLGTDDRGAQAELVKVRHNPTGSFFALKICILADAAQREYESTMSVRHVDHVRPPQLLNEGWPIWTKASRFMKDPKVLFRPGQEVGFQEHIPELPRRKMQMKANRKQNGNKRKSRATASKSKIRDEREAQRSRINFGQVMGIFEHGESIMQVTLYREGCDGNIDRDSMVKLRVPKNPQARWLPSEPISEEYTRKRNRRDLVFDVFCSRHHAKHLYSRKGEYWPGQDKELLQVLFTAMKYESVIDVHGKVRRKRKMFASPVGYWIREQFSDGVVVKHLVKLDRVWLSTDQMLLFRWMETDLFDAFAYSDLSSAERNEWDQQARRARSDGQLLHVPEHGQPQPTPVVAGHFLSWQDKFNGICQIVSALAGIQAKGRIHGDVKPENILIDASHNYYFTDFGASEEVPDHQIIPRGTALYMSPEFWRHDLYYEFARGQRTREGDVIWDVQKNEVFSLGMIAAHAAMNNSNFIELTDQFGDHRIPFKSECDIDHDEVDEIQEENRERYWRLRKSFERKYMLNYYKSVLIPAASPDPALAASRVHAIHGWKRNWLKIIISNSLLFFKTLTIQNYYIFVLIFVSFHFLICVQGIYRHGRFQDSAVVQFILGLRDELLDLEQFSKFTQLEKADAETILTVANVFREKFQEGMKPFHSTDVVIRLAKGILELQQKINEHETMKLSYEHYLSQLDGTISMLKEEYRRIPRNRYASSRDIFLEDKASDIRKREEEYQLKTDTHLELTRKLEQFQFQIARAKQAFTEKTADGTGCEGCPKLSPENMNEAIFHWLVSENKTKIEALKKQLRSEFHAAVLTKLTGQSRAASDIFHFDALIAFACEGLEYHQDQRKSAAELKVVTAQDKIEIQEKIQAAANVVGENHYQL